ncbi:phage morphogenesis protein [Clostridium beijerinckii]|uniref:phage morphogenesis protein n=1 Tax=Clostridium beijerinckii TaxID=1520 RepID=UPI00156DA702|nr:phage morphogenesis protein [Clostridium beijerinckii]NRU52556.1 uncharacterized coiled-coil DUF342 family protein [Clostridium beijerinckii]NYC69267.1 uncharacterized coiled-coil DUF342 family protein [Clostridium beijerinckii]NYC91757.1 uncharacterized coiled-coil DUF342 family protein [Clostridium beijerinckii]
MEEQNKKIGQFQISFNSLTTVPNDPTIMKAKVILFDFERSGNNQIIEKAVAEENIKFLIGKRICCKYISKEDNGGELDALGDHEQYETTNRDDKEVVYTDTEAIGFIENVYIDNYTDNNGNTKEVVYGDVILWCDDHYADIIGLLKEWLEKNIPIHMSVEYYYFNYTVKDGIEYIQSPILFNAHTVLNSEDRGYAIEVLPSYECATLVSFNELKEQWNKAINSLNSKQNKVNNQLNEENLQNNSLQSSENLDSNKLKQINKIQKEDETIMENIFLNAMKSNNELSFGDVRDLLYDALASVMVAEEYFNVWISQYGVYEDYFLYETIEDSKWVNYKVSYTKNADDTVTIDYATKSKVEYNLTLVSVDDFESSQNAKLELEKSQNELKSANAKIEELGDQMKSLNEKLVEKSNNSKVDTDKFNELTEKLVSLNAMVSEMQPIVDKYNKDAFEKSFNKAKEDYKVTFTSINALDVFELESTQELIKESINSVKEKADTAKFSLNALIVNSIKPIEEKINEDDVVLGSANVSINQITKAEDTKELTDVEDGVLSEYGFNY